MVALFYETSPDAAVKLLVDAETDHEKILSIQVIFMFLHLTN